MKDIDWPKLEGSFWKPDNNTQYIVEFTNPRIEEKLFKDSTTPKAMLYLDVVSVEKDEGDKMPTVVHYHPYKTFSTINKSFLESIKPLIQKAIANNQQSVIVFLTKTGSGSDTTYSINDASVIKKYRS